MNVVSEPACYLLFRKENTLLFVMREHTGFMDGRYSLPAGHVEGNETYAAGAIREAEEEVGLQVTRAQLKHVFTMHRFTPSSDPTTRTDVFFEALHWEGEPVNAEPDKHSELAWLPIDALPDSVMDYQRVALQAIQTGQTYGEFDWGAL